MSFRNPVTIADVAKAAGVSPGTVSRVLNQRAGDIRISEATRQQVLEAANRLGYRPNVFASALRTQRTGVIGAIVRDINDPFFGVFARELQRVAHEAGSAVLWGHAQYDLETAERQLHIMSNWFDGVLMVGDLPGDGEIITSLKERRTPYVSVARGTQLNDPFVNINELAGVQMALDYLYQLGHRRIAFVGTLERVGIQQRFRVFEAYIRDHNLFWIPEYLISCANERLQGMQAALTLLALPQPPTAIFCATDLLAVGAITGAWQAGWRVPEAVSIIGFDDIEEATCTYPTLTTVRQPVRHMAEAAYRVLTGLMHSAPDEADQQILIEPTLKIRRSCAPPFPQPLDISAS